MAEDDQAVPEATTSAPAPVPVAKAAPKRPMRRRKVQKTARAATPAPKAPVRAKSAGGGVSKTVIYSILIVLVVVTSFVVGYFAGTADLFASDGGSNIATGTVDIIEYSDFQCPFCSRAAPTVDQIKSTYGDKVRITYKHFPLESIHPDALGAAIAAECVRKLDGEEAFWTYHDTLFANQGALDSASLKRYAQAQGVSGFDSCFDSKETEATIREHMAEGTARGVRGTPSFWIGDELVVGALPFEQFKAVIDRKLSGEAAPAPAAPAAPTAPAAPAARVDVATGKNVLGEADAPVTIVEFSDFQCPYCQRFYTQTEQQIVDAYVTTGKARIAYRHFPLSFHQNAQISAEAAECAADQGKFWEMHDLLFTRGQGDGTGLDSTNLKAYAKELGLNTATFNTCLDSGAKTAMVQADFAAGQAAGVSGTPAFFINGRSLVGAQPFSAFQAAIDAELAG